MDLRASVLVGTDLVALSIWPADDEPGAGDSGLPVEVCCVDQALAAALEDLVARYGPDPSSADVVSEQERAARRVLRSLIHRAQRHHHRPR